MWDSVRDYWVEFNRPLEGVVRNMYLDVKELVTTGMGNLIDSPDAAAELNWLHEDGSQASYDEVVQEWQNVKSRTDLAQLGGGHFGPPVTSLHLDDTEIDRIVWAKLDQNESYLANRDAFADLANWPADAQLGLFSMAWALGPAFNFPKFQGFVAARQWDQAAEECTFGPHAGTIIQRNALDQQLFHNATQVDNDGLDPSVLLLTQ